MMYALHRLSVLGYSSFNRVNFIFFCSKTSKALIADPAMKTLEKENALSKWSIDEIRGWLQRREFVRYAYENKETIVKGTDWLEREESFNSFITSSSSIDRRHFYSLITLRLQLSVKSYSTIACRLETKDSFPSKMVEGHSIKPRK